MNTSSLPVTTVALLNFAAFVAANAADDLRQPEENTLAVQRAIERLESIQNMLKAVLR